MASHPPSLVLACEIYPPAIGGPATHARDFYQWLRHEGISVYVATLGATTADDDVYAAGTLESRLATYWRYLKALFTHTQPHTTLYAMGPLVSGGICLAIRAIRRCRVVIRVPGDRAWEMASMRGSRESFESFQTKTHSGFIGLISFLQRWILRHADMVIAQSNVWKDLLARWGVSVDRIAVVPNAVPFASAPRTPHSIQEKKNILAAGRLVPWKRFDDLIAAYERIYTSIPDATLTIVGNGPEESRLRARAARTTCASHISFVTNKTDKTQLDAYWRDACLFVLPSSYEGFSNLILEAWQYAVPVLASDIPANHELVADGIDGVLFPVGNSSALAHALQRLLSSRVLREQIAAHASHRVLQFDRTIIFQKLLTYLLPLPR